MTARDFFYTFRASDFAVARGCKEDYYCIFIVIVAVRLTQLPHTHTHTYDDDNGNNVQPMIITAAALRIGGGNKKYEKKNGIVRLT